MFNIKSSSSWLSCEKISKGWSSDEKYKIETQDGQALLLRISDISTFDNKKKEFEIVKKYSKLGFAMSQPVDFGICNAGKSCYMLLTFVEGEDLEEALPTFSEKEQYLLGRKAGKILRKIHSIPIDECDIPTQTKREKKLYQLSRYEEATHLRRIHLRESAQTNKCLSQSSPCRILYQNPSTRGNSAALSINSDRIIPIYEPECQ